MEQDYMFCLMQKLHLYYVLLYTRGNLHMMSAITWKNCSNRTSITWGLFLVVIVQYSYIDRFYSSMDSIKTLDQMEWYFTGTVMKSQFPKEFQIPLLRLLNLKIWKGVIINFISIHILMICIRHKYVDLLRGKIVRLFTC